MRRRRSGSVANVEEEGASTAGLSAKSEQKEASSSDALFSVASLLRHPCLDRPVDVFFKAGESGATETWDFEVASYAKDFKSLRVIFHPCEVWLSVGKMRPGPCRASGEDVEPCSQDAWAPVKVRRGGATEYPGTPARRLIEAQRHRRQKCLAVRLPTGAIASPRLVQTLVRRAIV